jgi:phenylacetate-CoA ligase
MRACAFSDLVAREETSLSNLLLVAARAPAYKRRFTAAGVIEETEDAQPRLAPQWRARFADVPVLRRDELRARPDDFIVSLSGVTYRGTTSGTRSSAYIYFAGEEWDVARLAGVTRLRRAWGLRDDVPTINVASRLLPSRVGDASLVGPVDAQMAETLNGILATGPCVLRGYPSRLAALAGCMQQRFAHNVLAVVATGEVLFPFQERLICMSFDCPVHNEYGCLESGIYGGSCVRCGAILIDDSRCIYEVVNGTLVTTDLLNRHMPMVRYVCGDVVDDGDHCGCRGLRVLGRSEDLIVVDGRRQYPGAFRAESPRGAMLHSIGFSTERAIATATLEVGADAHRIAQELANICQHFLPSGMVDVRLAAHAESQFEAMDTFPSKTWIAAVRRGRWSQAELASCPTDGALAPFAKLLSLLVGQRIIVAGYGVHASVETQMRDCMDVGPLPEPEEEALAVRVLLLACAAMHPAALMLPKTLEAACGRASTLLSRRPQSTSPESVGALVADLSTAAILLQAPLVAFVTRRMHPGPAWPLDRLSVQLVLQCAEHAVFRAKSAPRDARHSRGHIALAPILGVMIADFHEFAAVYGPWLPSLWMALLGTDSGDYWHCPNELANFVVRSRMSALAGEPAAVPKRLRGLRRERQELERAYALLLAGIPLDPEDWLTRFNRHSTSRASHVDPSGWMPVLRAIASPLVERGHRAEGYQALLASAPPTAATSLFEVLTRGANEKRSVLFALENVSAGGAVG